MERSYYPGSGVSTERPYQQEQPGPAPPPIYYGAPDMQQCYPQHSNGFYPNDPHSQYMAWTQQNQAWEQFMIQQQQHMQHTTNSGYIPPPPPPPPPALLMPGAGSSSHSPPICNLAMMGMGGSKEAIAMNARKKEAPSFMRILTSTVNEEELNAASAAAAATSATISLSSTSTTSIPSLLEGMRGAEGRPRSRTQPDAKAIEHAISVLSSRSSTNRRRSEGRSSRNEERSDSRKENRDSTRDRKRDDRRVDDRRDRDRERLRSSHSTRSRDSHRDSRSDRERRRNGERREESKSRRRDKEKEKERGRDKDKEVKAEPASQEEEEEVRPSDIQLNVRESAQEEGGVQVFLHSDEEGEDEEEEEQEGEDEEEESYDDEDETEEAGAAESDMDIATEEGDSDAGDSCSSQMVQLQQQLLQGSSTERGTISPENEDENRLTPKIFFNSGPSRRVNHHLYKEKYVRARALASQSLTEDYRTRFDLISWHLRSRCIFRGLQSSCGPDAPKLTIDDPRPKSKFIQTFPSKESNVQYSGPDAYVAPSAYKKTAAAAAPPVSKGYAGAPPGTYSYMSQTKLVRTLAAPTAAAAATSSTTTVTTAAAAPRITVTTSNATNNFSLKRTIQNGAAATGSSTTVAAVAAKVPAAPAADEDGPTPAKLSKVDEILGSLFLSSPTRADSADESASNASSHATSRESVVTPMKKSASESRVGAAAEKKSDEQSVRPSVSSPIFPLRSPRPIPSSVSSVSSPSSSLVLPPRSALSFRKIGDQIVRPGSKICFEWAESKSCKAGVFCHYEHGEGTEKTEKKVCSRMLRGLCRGESSCPLPHGLLPHQMPICEHYLRMQCKHGPEECELVHIKHNPKVQVCVFFNQGKCTKEDDCSYRHQYRPDVVRAMGVHASSPEQRSRTVRLPKGRALLTAETAAGAASPTASSATSSPSRPVAAAASAAEVAEDTSTFAWIE